LGIIRKTVSISTLGIVPFRSRKELLKRAEKDRRAAEAELSREHAARAEADRRVVAAQKRVQQAELTALHEAKSASKAKAKVKGRRARRKQKHATGGARELLGDLVAAAQPVVQEQAKMAGRKARKAAKASRHAAERAQREATRGGRRARARLHEMEQAMAPRVEAATERAQAMKDEVVDLTTSAADKVKIRAEAARESR
jgi:hypothetical protein